MTAVVVTFNPDLPQFEASLRTLIPQCAETLVFDNSEEPGRAREVRALCDVLGATYLGGHGNIGIAAAQNEAVRCISTPDAQDGFVTFFDQDSSVRPGFIGELRASFERLRALDPTAAILGALPIREDGSPYRIEALGRLENYWRLDFVISSGSIIKRTELRDIGGFREDLFIDLVDNELSWRLRRQGRTTYADTALPFAHSVGTGKVVRLFGKQAPVSAPFRHYYQVRNILLVGRSGVLSGPQTVRRLLVRFVAVLLAGFQAGHLRQRLKYLARGVLDGLRGRGGRYP